MLPSDGVNNGGGVGLGQREGEEVGRGSQRKGEEDEGGCIFHNVLKLQRAGYLHDFCKRLESLRTQIGQVT